MAQWLRLHVPYAGGPDLILGQGAGSRMLQLSVRVPQLKIPRVATKTRLSQINKCFFKKEDSVTTWKMLTLS